MATTTIEARCNARPTRLAFILPNPEPELLLSVIARSTSLWGGIFNPIVILEDSTRKTSGVHYTGKNMLDSSESGWDDGNPPRSEEEPMTLCIAAECEYRGNRAIAMCADWRAQVGDVTQPDSMTGTDDIFKLRMLGKSTAMLAGHPGKASELVSACKPVIKTFTDTQVEPGDYDLAVDQLMQGLRQVAVKKKAELIRNYVESTTGITHSEFIRLPTDQYSDVWHAVRQLNLGADILISHVSHESAIVRLDRWGEVHWENNYSLIGSGSEVARAMLCLQTWEPSKDHKTGPHFRIQIPLEECLYRLSEAHLAAHKANPSSVGALSVFQVLTANYRSTPKPEYIQSIHRIFDSKHQVPGIKRGERNEMLYEFQSFATGDIETQEPDDL